MKLEGESKVIVETAMARIRELAEEIEPLKERLENLMSDLQTTKLNVMAKVIEIENLDPNQSWMIDAATMELKKTNPIKDLMTKFMEELEDES